MLNYNDVRKSALNNCRNYKSKNYPHFDKTLSKGQIAKLLSKFNNPRFVKSYRHLPFICFNITFNKYKKVSDHHKGLCPKERPISLPSHHDALLLKYYSEILSICYEEYVNDHNMENLAIAYRKNRSNITGAKEVFDTIWKNENCWIIKGDFEHFFDNLNHKVLFKNVRKVLNKFIGNKLPEDWISVLSFLTKYRKINKNQLDKIKNCLKNGHYLNNLSILGKYINDHTLNISKKNSVGIPQGTAISAVSANVYMIGFDKNVQNILQKYQGSYRRYSDDFAIIIPTRNCSFYEMCTIKNKIIKLSEDKLSLKIKNEKTEVLSFCKEQHRLLDCYSNKEKSFDYLGFSFNGKSVFLRPKTIYKFHYRGKHAIHLLVRNMRERKIAKVPSDNSYKALKISYLNSKRFFRKEKVSKRLDKIRGEYKKGIGLRGRKKTTIMYLLNKPINKKNMLSYAYRSQRLLSAKIPECSDLYNVCIKKKVVKEIGAFQQEFGCLRKKG